MLKCVTSLANISQLQKPFWFGTIVQYLVFRARRPSDSICRTLEQSQKIENETVLLSLVTVVHKERPGGGGVAETSGCPVTDNRNHTVTVRKSKVSIISFVM